MIEIICNKDESDKNSHHVKEGVTSIRRPKNIKQIGDVSSDKKIYIEDYAFTYINSIAYNNPMIEQAGVLLGELQKDSEEKCVFVKGVIKSVVEDKGERIRFDENVWNRIYSDTEKYFPNLSVVGWFAVVPDLTKERLVLVMLDSRLNLIKDSVISIGTVNSSLVSVKEVFSEACKNKAVSIVLIHNHPSGDPAYNTQQ